MDNRTIWGEKQNRPILIARDVCEVASQLTISQIFSILLRRGVFKWFAVRRDLIKYKNRLKSEIRRLNELPYRTAKEKGRLVALVEVRKRLREMCHSERWRAPDNDRHAQTYLEVDCG